jgi:hypothetical protein
MKRRNLLLSGAAAGIVMLSSFAAFYPSGAPASVTGSPGDGANCSQCHGGTATTASGWITSNIPAGGYIAGQTYQITATNSQTGSGKYGFEVSPQNTSGSLLGTLAAGTGSKLVGSGKYVTHSNASATLKVWTFPWTAPASGTGNVTFYGAFARNFSGATVLSNLSVSEQTNTGITEPLASHALISPNPSNGKLTVAIPESMSNSSGTLQILNTAGKSVYSTKYAPGNNNNLLVDVSDSPRGVYFMILQNASANKFEKFIIE